ncbi:MAG: esterase-like activity of phytase family protein, partial [Gemmataceae bacterium]
MAIFLLACLLNPGQASLLGKLEIPGTATDLSGLNGKLNDGSPANLLGGIGSALASGGKPGEFFVLPDRGPGDGAANYPCRWHQVTLSLAPDGKPAFTLRKTTLLQDRNGQPFQGLAADLKNRMDPEGLRVGPWPACVPQRRNRVGPAFYISEEYEPKVALFQQDGTLALDLPTPAKLRVSQPNQDAETELAHNKQGRQPNTGFEGLALDPEGRELWAATQG